MLLTRTTLVKALRPTWLTLCFCVLAYAWLNRNVPGTDEAVLWVLIILTFPVALTLSTLGFGVLFLLDRFAGITVPGGLGFNGIFWLLSVSVAYWFWFVFIPRQAGHGR